MKKFSLLLMVVFVASMVFGQNLMNKKTISYPVKSGKTQQTKELQIIWENDLSNAAEWTMEYSQDNPNDGPWVIGTEGPAGYYSAGMGAIESTTAANGFGMYDSDAIGTDASGTQDSKLIYSGSIDCSAYSNVSVQFESYYRMFHGTPYLEVSVDGGTNWTQYAVHTDLSVNGASANPTYVVVNISTVAANQANVKIRFRYIGEWDYAWMVDDVKMFVAPDYDVSLIQARVNFWPQYINYGFSGFYGQIPAFQMNGIGAPVWFSGIVKNYGTQDATPVITASVKDGSMAEIYNIQKVYEGTLTTEQQDTITTSYDPIDDAFALSLASDQDYQMYTWEISTDVDGVTDENPENNMLSYSTYFTPAMYAHDNDNLTGSWSTGNYTTGGIDGDIVGVTYPIFVDCEVNFVEFWLSSMTEVGTSYIVKLMVMDEATEEWTEVSSSALVTIDNEEQAGTMQHVEMSDVYSIDAPDGGYVEILVAVEMYFSGLEFRLGVDATAPTSGWDSWIYFAGEDAWYYSGTDFVPVIRLSVGPYSGTNNNVASQEISVYPNPTRDMVTLTNVEGANIQVVDITGKVLVNTDAAQNNLSVDMSAFAQGTYIVRIMNENGLTVKKVNLVK